LELDKSKCGGEFHNKERRLRTPRPVATPVCPRPVGLGLPSFEDFKDPFFGWNHYFFLLFRIVVLALLAETAIFSFGHNSGYSSVYWKYYFLLLSE
jgi:hypothetical protein